MRTRLLSPNRQRAIEFDDGEAAVTLLDLEHHITICRDSGYSLTAANWAPRGDCFAIGSPYKTVRVWDARTGELMTAHTGAPEQHKGLCRIVSIAWSPDNRVGCSREHRWRDLRLGGAQWRSPRAVGMPGPGRPTSLADSQPGGG